jgi:uncharacterized protein
MQLTESDKGILLLAARESIDSLFGEDNSPLIDFNYHPKLRENAGAFVTLSVEKELRGCIGYIISDMSLYDTVCEAAMKAATEDPRFDPIMEKELSKMEIEISVLSVPESIKSIEEIEIGKHGLLLDDHAHRAVLLPQVAVEYGYSATQFLNALCEKAGLEPMAYERKALNLKVFTATVFSEAGNRRKTYEFN